MHNLRKFTLPLIFLGLALTIPPLWIYTDPETSAATKDEILDSHVRIDVEWNNYNTGNGNISQTGSFFVEVRGTIIRVPDNDPFFYAPKNLVANYNYQDRSVYVGHSGRCPELYSEQKGSGTVRILNTDEVGDPTKEGVFELKAGLGWEQPLSTQKELQGKGRTPARRKPVTKEPNADVYTFVLTVPMGTTLTEQSNPCSRYEASPRPEGVALASYMNLRKQGMYGSYSWTSNTLDTGLQIRNYPNQTQFEPQKGEGNVKYRVSWSLGKVKPLVQIFRVTDEGREDITDTKTDILVGQKVKLEAVIVPYGGPGKGKWGIPSPVIADFKAYAEKGEVALLEDKEKERVEFFFVNGDFTGKSVQVKYTTSVDNQTIDGKTTFRVFEPLAQMEVQASPSAEINVLTDKEKGTTSCRLYLGKVGQGISGIKITSKVYLPDPFLDQGHFLEYIQLIKEDILEYHNAIYWHYGSDTWLLDTHYPYLGLVAEGELEMDDLPGSDLGLLHKELHQYQQFQTFLMFRPKPHNANSAWVPLKLMEWDWSASAIRNKVYSFGKPVQPSDFNLINPRPASPKKKGWEGPPETYPQWIHNVTDKDESGNSKWRHRVYGDWPQRVSGWRKSHPNK